jgi:hypothetical protein
MEPRSAPPSLTKWGLVQGWLAALAGRRVEIRATVTGLEVLVADPSLGETRAAVDAHEDPSAAAWRAILDLDPTTSSIG